MGNIPKSLTDEEMRKVIEETGPGVENIELLKVEILLINLVVSLSANLF